MFRLELILTNCCFKEIVLNTLFMGKPSHSKGNFIDQLSKEEFCCFIFGFT